MNSSPGRRTEEAQQSAGGCPREPKDAKSNRYPVITNWAGPIQEPAQFRKNP